jgi:putative ABC transport system ATP-binding protein
LWILFLIKPSWMQLELQNITLRLGEKLIFKNFHLKIAAGEKMLITGASGRGKSSLLRMILGFIRPDEGEVVIDGKPLNRQTIWSLRRRMAFVAQEIDLGAGSVKDFFLETYAYRANRHLTYDQEQTLALFQRFDLEPDKLDQAINKLSGGEKQRVAIILALLLNRELYLLDEITSAMNEELSEKVIDYLANLEGKTMIVVSHRKDWKNYGFREIHLGD